MIRHRVVNRLNKLNKKIQSHIDGEPLQVDIRGQDEIADIARSFRYFTRTIEIQQQQLQELSLTDGLTGIANRRALDEHLPTYLQSAIRHHWPVSLLLMDVDYFKPYNDNYGHNKGDECLQQIAKILTRCKRRDEDFVARYGGEEFVFVLPQSDNRGAELVATLLQQAIEEQRIPHEHSLVADHVTMSIGIATFHYDDPISADQLLKNADTALYEAKNLGRNRFVSFIE
nr:GGDEF domain-containing protein [Neptunicella marina]